MRVKPRHVLVTAGAVTAAVVAAMLPSQSAAASTIPNSVWACRNGRTQASLILTVVGTVCARRSGATWQGKTTLTLTSRSRPVTGTAYLMFAVIPEEPRFDLEPVPIHLAPHTTKTITIALSAAATPSDLGGVFTDSLMVNWGSGNGSGPAAELSSPIVWSRHASGGPSHSTFRGKPVCLRGTINNVVQASYTYCISQVGTRLRGTGSVTYRTTRNDVPLFLTVGQAVNTDRKLFPGQTLTSTRIATTTVQLPPSQRLVTVALPVLSSQLLTTDKSAVSYAFSGITPVVSKVLKLR